ncbi:MAG: DUF4038 domain-containing protein [Verrucomicrobiae bacterium]|nr:DUF4038 domain-containing protein [Verrucomicrobiae bacterium]
MNPLAPYRPPARAPTAARLALLAAILAARLTAAPTQYRPVELDFAAARDHTDPFDPGRAYLTINCTHESGTTLAIPGFWDGGRTWRARLQPQLAGRWAWTSASDDPSDAGLHGRRGEILVAPPSPDAPDQQRRGGILRVAPDHTHLTYADGTPFFWLADTWWGMPSGVATPEHLARLIARRRSQGFTLAQIHGHRNLSDPDGPDVFQLMEAGGDGALAYWRRLDAYYRIAEEFGWHLCVGFYGYFSEMKYSLDTHHRLWSYFLARYGAYPITFLITQEYNQPLETRGADGKTTRDPNRTHGPFFTALGRWIHERDPYRRAMTAHSAVRSRDRFDAWREPWYGFALLQNGHFTRPDPAHYRTVCAREPKKPVIEGEANYEGFVRPTPPPFTVDATAIRASAYGAIQSGCIGYSYGAQGLYAHITNPAFPGPTARWGPVLTWDQALELEGARHMAHLGALYRSLPWWRLSHLPNAIDGTDAALAKADGDRLCLVYFLPADKPAPPASRLSGFANAGAPLSAMWFDPRSGAQTPAPAPAWDAGAWLLPPRPDGQDWMLILRRQPTASP